MAQVKIRFFNVEKTLFFLLTGLAAFFIWRAGMVDAGLESVGLPPVRAPLPKMPGPPEQTGIEVTESMQDPAARLDMVAVPDFWAPGARNPFAGSFDSLRVVAAKVTAQMTVTPRGGVGEVEIEYRILPHPVSEFEFLLPAEATLTRVYGSGVINQTAPQMRDLGEEGRQYVVKLRSPVDKRYVLRLRLRWTKPAQMQTMKVPEVLLSNMTHERGVIILSAQPGMRVRVKNSEKVSSLDLAQLSPALKRPGTFVAFSYNKPGYAVWLDVSGKAEVVIKPKIEDPIVGPEKPKPPKNPNTPLKNPNTPKNPTVVVTPKEIDKWTLPIGFVGTGKVGTKRFALLKDKDDNIRKVLKGDVVLGMTIVQVKPSSVIVRNEKGVFFEFKDKLRGENEY
jgi:hypothetical protein